MLAVGDQIQLKPNHSELVKGWWDKTINTLRNDYGSIVDIQCIETHLWNVVLEVGDTDPNYDYLVSYFDSEGEHGMFIDYCDDLDGFEMPINVFKTLYGIEIWRGQGFRKGSRPAFVPSATTETMMFSISNLPTSVHETETVIETMVMKAEDIAYLGVNKSLNLLEPPDCDKIEPSPFFIFGRSPWFNARKCLTPFCEVPNSELHYVIRTDGAGYWELPNLYEKIG